MPQLLKDGYYKKWRAEWEHNKKLHHIVEYFEGDVNTKGHAAKDLLAQKFTFTPVHVMTKRELDELLLEAYTLGVGSLPLETTLLILAKEEAK